jgi:hypothetical protein
MDKQPAADRNIDAMPTKELFIAMLTRDVALIPAIIDLADNCTDGARRLRGAKPWSDLEVTIEAKTDKFSISDNCGGMDVETARRYAFRFGREAGAESTKGEVGRFGVGMKRGLFKLGRHFHIHSTTKKTQFDVTIDVEKWAKRQEWQFEFDRTPTEDGNFPAAKHGTDIIVTKVHPQVADHFKSEQFIQELRQQLTSKLETSLANGLTVKVNGESLKPHIRKLVSDKALAPGKKRFTLAGSKGKKVTVELWCGLGKPESHSSARAESGWYVFCNGRMLLEADKTTATGWGVEDDESIPAYHPQFNDFRGYAYLDADDAADLPWNTTKTALDTDHPVYRSVRQHMVALARPVINYFNKRKEENDALKAAGDEGSGRLQSLFDDAKTMPLDDITARAAFSAPPVQAIRAARRGPALQRIQFDADAKKAEEVRDHLGVSSWMAVGREVFDYYYNAECGDE